MLNAKPNIPDMNLTSLFAETANEECQISIDEFLPSDNFTIFRNGVESQIRLRASSPHVLSIDSHFDTQLSLIGIDNMTTLNLCPHTLEDSTFVFNMGITALKQSIEEEILYKIPEDMAQTILSRLGIGETVSDYGDLPKWLHVARTDQKGSVVLTIDSDQPRRDQNEKISALFMEEGGIIGSSRPVEHRIMTGLWTLGLAVKIQQQAKASGTEYDLIKRGISRLNGGSRESISRMLLALDNH